MERYKKNVDSSIIRVLETPQGFLYHDIDEGFNLEDDEVNYRFTNDPLEAYQMYGLVPKYLEITSDKKLDTEQDCCDFLNGEIVSIKVTKTTEWEVLE